MQDNILKILHSLGIDTESDGLKDTPRRYENALRYLTQGYNQDINELINRALFQSNNNDMIIVKNIEFYSLCEHHLLPFFGVCHVGYLPNGHVIGLSKIARIVDVFSKRLQIQENLTQHIANCLLENIKASGVGVIMEAKHLCMMMRGIEKQNSLMTTSSMLGRFKDDAKTRAEFLSLIRGNME